MTTKKAQTQIPMSEMEDELERGLKGTGTALAEALEGLLLVAGARAKGRQREHARLRAKKGDEHPRVKALSRRVKTDQSFVGQLAFEAVRARTTIPEADPKKYVLFGHVALIGRAVDMRPVGVPGLTVALFDCKGERVDSMGFAFTDTNGYFELLSCKAADIPDGPVHIRVLNENGKHIYVDDRSLYPAAGKFDSRVIYLHSTDPVGTPPDTCPTPPQPPKPKLEDLTVTPDKVAFGETAQGMVTLSGPAPEGGALVALSVVGNENVAEVPSTVAVPEGALSATFEITTNDIVGAAFFDVVIQASFEGVQKSAKLRVEKVPGTTVSLKSISLAKTGVEGGKSVKGWVKLTTADHGEPVGVQLYLTRAHLKVATVEPVVVEVPENSDTGEFVVKTRSVWFKHKITVQARYRGESRAVDLLILPRRLARRS